MICIYMRTCFVGKGGSGKTTVCGLFARFLAAQHASVLAIDADINQHLAVALGASMENSERIPSMGNEINFIKEFLRGTNSRILDNVSTIKTTPPGFGSNLFCLQTNNPLWNRFRRTINGVGLLSVGAFESEDLGVKCFHAKTGSVELLLNHLIDKEDEYVLVDMTAGADAFASGLFTKFDVTYVVVEPTIKSISVYEQYKAYTKEFDVCLKVIGNKVQDESDIAFLHDRVGSDLIATIDDSRFIKQHERGEMRSMTELEPSNVFAMMILKNALDAQKKDWRKLYRQACEFHKKNAESWGNAATGKNLLEQIDPIFSLEDAI